MNLEKVKLELAKKEAEEKLRKEKEEAEEMERRRRNPEKSKTHLNSILLTAFYGYFLNDS